MRTKQLIIALVGFAALYALIPVIVFVVLGKPKDAGEFGDTFGFVNAIVSGFALLAVAYTLHQQQLLIEQGQKQLEMQKEELRQNTAMLGAQRDEMVRQNTHLERQELESRFFRLLEALNRLVEGIRIKVVGEEFYGRAAFLFFLQQLMQEQRPSAENQEGEALRRQINDWYTGFYKRCGNEVGHYFRMVFRVLAFIHTSKLAVPEKHFFARVLRAQFSQPELVLLFYNALADYGYSKIERAVETESMEEPTTYELLVEYDVLVNIDPHRLSNPRDMSLYPQLEIAEGVRRREISIPSRVSALDEPPKPAA